MKLTIFIAAIAILSSCGQKEQPKEEEQKMTVADKLQAYAKVEMSADISHLTEKQQALVKKLVEAGKIADAIFWRQSAPDAIEARDSLMNQATPESQLLLDYVLINYGPYDHIYDNERFVGEGPETRPLGANFYPLDMTKEEFENYVAANPDQKEVFESLYTVVERDGDKLKAVYYHEKYPETAELVAKLEEAAELADNESLKKYLKLRAEAIAKDDYYASDMAWMNLEGNDVDVIIGPIETYDDKLFGAKASYEAFVLVKDKKSSEELQMFKKHINQFEHNLPYDKKYIRETVGGGEHGLNIFNVAYAGGDAATKTIACNLPNDPAVRSVKGGKNSMYKNLMQAKFEKIVVPIAQTILVDEYAQMADKDCFMSFVTLHEISHSLGRDYVYGKDSLKVREALADRYSAIEECKADILSMYNHKLLKDWDVYSQEYLRKAMATYVAGLYRSIRFGTQEAHGKANLIQLNFLREKGAINRNEEGKFSFDEEVFFDKVAELAKLVLTIEAQGDYAKAGEVLKLYGKVSPEIEETIESLKGIPRDLDTEYKI